MWMKDLFVLFLSLSMGYVVCVVAKKQVSVLKTLGYTIGIAIIAMSLLTALIAAYASPMKMKCSACDKMHGMQMMKHHK